jgi:5-methylcytosine-specific restriction endonuclease McrA
MMLKPLKAQISGRIYRYLKSNVNKHPSYFMKLLKQKVLVVNRLWQAIDETNVQTAMCDMVRGVATGIEMGEMRAVLWAEWATLPIRDGDRFLRTIHGPIRVPTVICKSSYAQMPKRVPKFNRRGVGERDGFICQYTGEYVPDGTIDHVVPRSRGGRNAWDNVSWSRKDLNHRKGNKTPQEAGLKLRRLPFRPKAVPACTRIRPLHEDWKPFLFGRG